MTIIGTGRGRSLYYTPEPGDEKSCAVLLDTVRQLLVDGLAQGDSIDKLVVTSDMHQLLRLAKQRELDAGRYLTILGLQVTSGSTAPAQPSVPVSGVAS